MLTHVHEWQESDTERERERVGERAHESGLTHARTHEVKIYTSPINGLRRLPDHVLKINTSTKG